MPSPSLRQLAALFLKLGATSFGGPAGGLALMEEEISRRRGWITRQRFAEMLALVKLLPGPVSTQLALWVGRELGGLAGGLISGLCFIVPSLTMLLCLSAIYTDLAPLRQQLVPTFAALQASALAVILKTTAQLFIPYRRDGGAWVIAAATLVAVLLAPRAEPLFILAFGLAGAWRSMRSEKSRALEASLLLITLFWICFKAAAFTFGTGLAVLPVLEAETVLKHGWLTHQQFLDGVALGQITPGPVLITATFLGFQTAGMRGAWIATAGIFLPAFILVLGVVPRLDRRLSSAPGTRGFVTWAIPAVVGAILGASLRLAVGSIQTPFAVGALAFSATLAFRSRVPAWALIPGAGLLAFLLSRFLPGLTG